VRPEIGSPSISIMAKSSSASSPQVAMANLGREGSRKSAPSQPSVAQLQVNTHATQSNGVLGAPICAWELERIGGIFDVEATVPHL
jgi:hypothetical protein